MKIEGLSYSEFALIRTCVQKERKRLWKEYTKLFKKDLTFEQVNEVKETFNKNINQFYPEGLCNIVLTKLENVEMAAQKSLGMFEE